MRKLLLIALLIALLPLAGCATTEQVWEGPGNFNMDQGQCQAQAFGTPFATNMQVALVYNSCMRGKGWQLVERPIQR